MKLGFLLPPEGDGSVVSHVSERTFMLTRRALRESGEFECVDIKRNLDAIHLDVIYIPRISAWHLRRLGSPYNRLYRDIVRLIKIGAFKPKILFHNLDIYPHGEFLTRTLSTHSFLVLTPAQSPAGMPYPGDKMFSIQYYTYEYEPNGKLHNVISVPAHAFKYLDMLQHEGSRPSRIREFICQHPLTYFHIWGEGWRNVMKYMPHNCEWMGSANDMKPYAPYKWVLDIHPADTCDTHEHNDDPRYMLDCWETHRMCSSRVFWAVTCGAAVVTDKRHLTHQFPNVCYHLDGWDVKPYDPEAITRVKQANLWSNPERAHDAKRLKIVLEELK